MERQFLPYQFFILYPRVTRKYCKKNSDEKNNNYDRNGHELQFWF